MKRLGRVYEWRGEPVAVDRRLGTRHYRSLAISVDQQVTVVSVGQHVLIEGGGDQQPYVAKVLRLYEAGGLMKVEVDWLLRRCELPRSKLALLGREPHPQEVFFYGGPSCDPEVSVESVLRPVQVQQLEADAPFPDPPLGQRDTLYVKLCWDSRTFRPPSPPSPPGPDPPARRGRAAACKRLRLGPRPAGPEGAEPEGDSLSRLLDEDLRASRRPPRPRGGLTPLKTSKVVLKKLQLTEEDRAEPRTSGTSRSSRRKSTLVVAGRIRDQMKLLSGVGASSDEDGDEFVASAEEEEEDEEEEDVSGKRTRRALAGPRSRPVPNRKQAAPRTPRQATPSIPSRSLPAPRPASVLEEARLRLHVSSVPESLPCREAQFQQVHDFLLSKILDGTGGCLYVSGVPGTGKTATVQEALRRLQQAVQEQQAPPFNLVQLNGMKLTQPHQAYALILQALTGRRATCDHAAALLEEMFSRPSPRKRSTVLLVDELDLLWTRKQDVLYNLFDWPTRSHAHLVVVAIANTMDLPERVLLTRVASRLGLTRMSFQPYSFRQLQQIVSSRLDRVKAFEDDALQLVSRKVAALSGDARRCLDISRRAVELCQQGGGRLVGTSHVVGALEETFSSPFICSIRAASLQEQLLLRSVVSEFGRLGLEEASFQQVLVQHRALCLLEGLQPPSVSEVQAACQRLGACRLLLLQSNRLGILQRLRLNASQDDVLYALSAA